MKYLSCVEIEPSVSATASVIWLHGLGSNGHDFETILPQLNLDKSMQKLMWKPIFSLEETIQATIYWYKEVFLNRKSPLKITAEQIDKYQKLINKKNSVL